MLLLPVNGGPSGIGAANIAGKSMFWDFVGSPESIKVIAFEGEVYLPFSPVFPRYNRWPVCVY